MKKWRCLGCGNEVKTSDNADQLEATEKAFEEIDKDQCCSGYSYMG